MNPPFGMQHGIVLELAICICEKKAELSFESQNTIVNRTHSELRSSRKVVIKELTILHNPCRVRLAGGVHVASDGGRNQTCTENSCIAHNILIELSYEKLVVTWEVHDHFWHVEAHGHLMKM